MAIGDVFTLQALWQSQATGLTAENQFHFKQTAALIFDTPGEDLVEAFRDDVEVTYQGSVHSTYFLIKYTVKAQPSGLTAYEFIPPTVAGGNGGDMLPPQTAAVLSIRSGHLGRTGRGRVYLPPTSEANSGPLGQPIAAYLTFMSDLATAIAGIESNVLYAGWQWGVWSVKDQQFYEMVSTAPNSRWGTQRGRTR